MLCTSYRYVVYTCHVLHDPYTCHALHDTYTCYVLHDTVQAELACEEQVRAAKEQGRGAGAQEVKVLQEELQRLQLKHQADADAARKVSQPPPLPPSSLSRAALQAAAAAEDAEAQLHSTIASMRM
jgi:hypothetical protein